MNVNFVWADCAGTSCTGVKITRLVVRSGGDISVGTSGQETNLDCDTDKYIALNKSMEGFDQIYALLLTAHTTEHPMWVRTNSSGSCYISYVVSDK